MLAEPPFSLLQNLSDVDDAIDCNAEIADAILECGLQAFNLPKKPELGHLQNWRDCAKAADVDKAHSTIRQFYRDWSAEGAQERQACNGYVLDQLRAAFQDRRAAAQQASRPKILVPGAGLGRLVYEICRAGYDVEGNEISYHQLLASSWILNHAGATPHPLYPFATQFTNLHSRKQQLRKVMIPDLHPAQALDQVLAHGENSGEMGMTAADFAVLYHGKAYHGTFDAVATVFFIDTAPNFLRYIDTVSNCLRTEGIWINVGPLLWHSDVAGGAQTDNARDDGATSRHDGDRDAGIGELGSVELTEEDVIWLLERKGFQIEHRDTLSEGVGYIQDPDSMFQNKYRVSCWVAKKTG
jgi:carnosine N-methyltransferase